MPFDMYLEEVVYLLYFHILLNSHRNCFVLAMVWKCTEIPIVIWAQNVCLSHAPYSEAS